MTSSLAAWFATRPAAPPSEPPPARGVDVIAVARATGGDAELHIVRRRDGLLTFEFLAWTNFEDAGRMPHHVWHTFAPADAFVTDSFDTVVAAALRDADTRQLTLAAIERIEK